MTRTFGLEIYHQSWHHSFRFIAQWMKTRLIFHPSLSCKFGSYLTQRFKVSLAPAVSKSPRMENVSEYVVKSVFRRKWVLLLFLASAAPNCHSWTCSEKKSYSWRTKCSKIFLKPLNILPPLYIAIVPNLCVCFIAILIVTPIATWEPIR